MKRLPKVINKHNSLTDGYVPKPPKQVLPDRLLNALYYKYEKEGTTFKISLVELKSLLGLENEKDNRRIYQAISILQRPIQIRDFTYNKKEISWISSPFLAKAVRYRESTNYIEFTIEPMVLEAFKQKVGFTPLNLDICNQFKTKYGLKLYELYRRYYSLPHKEDVQNCKVGVFKKSLEEINFLFGTSYRHPSQAIRSIKRGLEEIRNNTGIFIHLFFDKENRVFVFSWERDIKYPNQHCIIPTHQVEAFVSWYMANVIEEDSVKNQSNYRQLIKERVLNNTLYNLSEFYRFYLQEGGKSVEECFDNSRGRFTC